MRELPLKKAIENYSERDPVRFHMPGHKGVLSPYDVTELSCTDNLHSPKSAILESESLCAKVYGARDAFFLVNGSSAGVLTMLNMIGRGKRILLGRNCHKSAINGIALASHETVPLFPDENGLITAETVARTLDRTPCDAVFLTSPTYRGAVLPIDGIAEAAHSRGALLLLDCAHGAHFPFSEKLPPVPASADAWCVSCHKTLCALTQTALLLTGKNSPFEREKVQRTLNVFQSTSPSYELQLSIERSVLDPDDWDAHIKRLEGLYAALASVSGVRLINYAGSDVTRINIAFEGLTGYELEDILETHDIYPEMADRECVTLITTPNDRDEWYDRLIITLGKLAPAKTEKTLIDRFDPAELRGETVMRACDALNAPYERVPLEGSEGQICAEAVGCYPPGIAVLFPGERITTEAVKRLIAEKRLGAELFGTYEDTVAVVSEEAL